MTELLPEYKISDDKALLDLAWITKMLQASYWASTRSETAIRRSIENSLCYGVYERASGAQIGFARIVTDGATFAWLCDVVIDAGHRNRGLGKRLVEVILSDSRLNGVTFRLATKDAHSLYERYGFSREETMRRKKKEA